MSQETLETRVARLERQVSMLMRGRANENQPAADAWRKTSACSEAIRFSGR